MNIEKKYLLRENNWYLGCLLPTFPFVSKEKKNLRLITDILPNFVQEGCVVGGTEVCRGTPLHGGAISG